MLIIVDIQGCVPWVWWFSGGGGDLSVRGLTGFYIHDDISYQLWPIKLFLLLNIFLLQYALLWIGTGCWSNIVRGQTGFPNKLLNMCGMPCNALDMWHYVLGMRNALDISYCVWHRWSECCMPGVWYVTVCDLRFWCVSSDCYLRKGRWENVTSLLLSLILILAKSARFCILCQVQILQRKTFVLIENLVDFVLIKTWDCTWCQLLCPSLFFRIIIIIINNK